RWPWTPAVAAEIATPSGLRAAPSTPDPGEPRRIPCRGPAPLRCVTAPPRPGRNLLPGRDQCGGAAMTMTETLETIHDLVQRSDLTTLAKFAAEAPRPKISELLDRLTPVDAAVVFRLLPKDTAIDVFERLEPAAQADLVTELAEAEVVGVFEALDPDDVVGLLDELPAKVTKRLLQSLSERQRAATAPIRGSAPGSLGRRMSPEYAIARTEETVGQVLSRLRSREADFETIYTVPVVDGSRTLVGIVSLREL